MPNSSLQLILGPNLTFLDSKTKQEIINNLIIDIRNLLNTKKVFNFSDNFGFVTDYGLPDLSYYSTYSQKDREEVSNLITDCLRKFEPRLKDVTIKSLSEKAFAFKISAVFCLDTEQIPLILEAKITYSSQKIILRQHAR